MSRARLSLPVEAALVLAGLTILALAATYPLVRGLNAHLPNDLGDPLLNSWILAWDASRIRAGFHGLWDAPIFFPYHDTLTYSETLLGIAIFTAPIQWATDNPVLVYNIAFLGSFVLAGGGMYLLARALTGRRGAATVACVIYAFTPYRVAHIAHLQMLMWGWLPLSLWALHRYFSSGAWWFLLASAGSFLLLSFSNGYAMYFSVLPLAIVGITELWRVRPPVKRTLLHLGGVVMLMFALLAPMAGAYSRGRRDASLRRQPNEITAFSADVGDYFRGHRQVWIWRRVGAASGEHELFAGGGALLLTAIALFTARGTEAALLPYGAIAISAFLLSLGPQPTAWAHRLGLPGPYAWLITVVPGLDSLRSVGRLNMLVVLALSILAAVGVSWVLDRVAPGRRPLLAAAIAGAIFAEGWAAPIPTPRFDPAGVDHDAYTYLARCGPGAVVELPITLTDAQRIMPYQYMTLRHHHSLVNGHSGYDPPLLTFLDGAASPFGDLQHLPAAIEMLRVLGVRYLVIRPDAFANPAEASALMGTLQRRQANPSYVTDRRQFGKTFVFVLAAADEPPNPQGDPSPAVRPPPDLRLVPVSTIRAHASHEPERLPLVFDDDRDSRWLSGDRQTGHEWIELEFDRPRNVALIRMQTAERSFGDYPRELAIDAIEDQGTRTVRQGSILPQFARGFLRDHHYPNIDVPLPDNRSHGVRLRQLGTTDRLFWSIHELQVWER